MGQDELWSRPGGSLTRGAGHSCEESPSERQGLEDKLRLFGHFFGTAERRAAQKR